MVHDLYNYGDFWISVPSWYYNQSINPPQGYLLFENIAGVECQEFEIGKIKDVIILRDFLNHIISDDEKRRKPVKGKEFNRFAAIEVV